MSTATVKSNATNSILKIVSFWILITLLSQFKTVESSGDCYPNPSNLALSFSKIIDFNDYFQSMWTGYDAVTNRIYLFGGDRGPKGVNIPNPNGIYYDITGNQFVNYPISIADAHYAQTEDYTQIKRKMYRMITGKLFIFDMETEIASTMTVSTPSSDTTISGFVDHIALCSDGVRYLFAVGKNQLYIYDTFHLTVPPIQGPTLNDGLRQHHSCAYVQGAVYVIGGLNAANNNAEPIEKVIIDINNPATMSFSIYINAVTVGIRWGNRNIVSGQYIYVIGGSKMTFGGTAAVGTSDVSIIDTTNPVSGTLYIKAHLTQGRMFLGHAVDINGLLYAFGGQISTSTNAAVISSKAVDRSNIDIINDATSILYYEHYDGQQCWGSEQDLLRHFPGIAEECKAKCVEIGNECVGFIRVNSGNLNGQCFFRNGQLSAPTVWIGRDCYAKICETDPFIKHTGKQCTGTEEDVLRNYPGTADECKQKCMELGDECVGFIRVNSGGYGGKCFFRGGQLSVPTTYTPDNRDCYERTTTKSSISAPLLSPLSTAIILNVASSSMLTIIVFVVIGILVIINIFCCMYQVKNIWCSKHESYHKVVSLKYDESPFDDMQKLKEYQM